MALFARRTETVPCRITIAHDADNLEAHVELQNGAAPGVGDLVTVHGEAVRVQFGERMTFDRDATIRRANAFDKLFAIARSRFELTELYEVSFSQGRLR